MKDLFGHNYDSYPFGLFQLPHWLMLLLLLVGCMFFYYFRKVLVNYEKNITITMFGVLLVLESLYHWWLMKGEQWDLSFTLPLQLCSISLLLSLLLLLTKNEFIFQLVYYLGLSGAVQALLTPELFVGFPHFRFFQFFVTHMMIIWVAVYFLFVKSYRPTFKGLWQAFFCLNGIALFVFFINHWVDGNYMFLAGKPVNPTLLDYLGPYPYYILSLEGIALFLFTMLFLPFKVKKPKEVRQKG
ncbi:YwaF family protein [Robertmurraya korlensis]|uniref:YwaF family protein n=1 Tax=Robertmurraya korlensis TaxID=519977 RepID=UPI000824062C|nr:TIGR02206 family membrane protein [Robertmurraya korlensis]